MSELKWMCNACGKQNMSSAESAIHVCAITALSARVEELEAMVDKNAFDRFLVEQIKDNPELATEYTKARIDQKEYLEVIEKLSASNAKLREALEKIANYRPTTTHEYAENVVGNMERIAEEALR